MNPLAGFSLANTVYNEEHVTQLFIKTALKFSNTANSLMDEAFHLDLDLDIIQETLGLVSDLTNEELGDVPQMNVLSVLWTRLITANDYKQYQSHSHY